MYLLLEWEYVIFIKYEITDKITLKTQWKHRKLFIHYTYENVKRSLVVYKVCFGNLRNESKQTLDTYHFGADGQEWLRK